MVSGTITALLSPRPLSEDMDLSSNCPGQVVEACTLVLSVAKLTIVDKERPRNERAKLRAHCVTALRMRGGSHLAQHHVGLARKDARCVFFYPRSFRQRVHVSMLLHTMFSFCSWDGANTMEKLRPVRPVLWCLTSDWLFFVFAALWDISTAIQPTSSSARFRVLAMAPLTPALRTINASIYMS